MPLEGSLERLREHPQERSQERSYYTLIPGG
jgi:hypothetical protein